MSELLSRDTGAVRGGAVADGVPPDPAAPGSSLFRAIHRYLRGRYPWAILLGLLGAAAFGCAGWNSQVPLYRAEGLIYIEPSLRSPQDPLGIQVLPMFNGFVALQVQLLNSSDVTQSAMETDAWKKTGKGREPDAVQEFTERRTIVFEPGTQHIRVQFADAVPAIALAGVQALMSAYEAKSNERSSRDELLSRTKTQEEVLAASRADTAAQLLKLTSEFGGAQGIRLYHEATLSQLLSAQAELGKVTNAIRTHRDENLGTVAEAPRARTEGEIALENQPLADARLRLDLLQLEEDQLKQTTGEKNSMLVSIRQQIQGLRRWIDGFVVEWNRRLVEDWERRRAGGGASGTTLEELKAQEAGLASLIGELKSDIKTYVKRSVEIGDLQATYESQGRKLEQAKALVEQLSAQLLGTGRIQIAEKGTLPVAPYRNRRLSSAIAGAMVGGMLGVLLVVLLGLRSRKIRYADDMGASLGTLRLLGLLPTLPQDLSEPQSSEIAIHCVHQIRTLLQIGHAREAGACLCVTGPGVGTGKTTLSLALGLSFGRSGSRTLLVDADLTGRGLTRRVSQMLLSHARRVAGSAMDSPEGDSPDQDRVRNSSGLLEPAVDRHGAEDRPGARELSDLLSKSVERYGLVEAVESGTVSRLFALADLSCPPDARAGLAARLLSMSRSQEPGGEVSFAALVPPATVELGAQHTEFNGTPLERYLYPTGTDSLRFLPLRGLGTAGVISVATVSRILARVRRDFDVVLVDTGPVLGALETQIVAGQSDAVVFVVSPGDHRPDAERSVARLNEVGARVAGVVLNRAHPTDLLKVSGSYSARSSRGESP